MKHAATFVLYHADCADGFGAAVAAWHRLGDTATYLAVHHGHPMPEIPDGARVYMLDFSYARPQLEALARRCEVTVLDHHLTAQEALQGLPFAIFDRTRSGATLAWEYFVGSIPPSLLLYVEDRDLWRWQLPDSKAVSAGLAIEPRAFTIWTEIINQGSHGIAKLRQSGEAVLRYQETTVARLADKWRPAEIDGYTVPAVNSPVLQSEIGHELLERHPNAPFAAIYYDTGTGHTIWSLRSRADFSVAAVARKFGGGGHQEAAGFERAGFAIRLVA